MSHQYFCGNQYGLKDEIALKKCPSASIRHSIHIVYREHTTSSFQSQIPSSDQPQRYLIIRFFYCLSHVLSVIFNFMISFIRFIAFNLLIYHISPFFSRKFHSPIANPAAIVLHKCVGKREGKLECINQTSILWNAFIYDDTIIPQHWPIIYNIHKYQRMFAISMSPFYFHTFISFIYTNVLGTY